MINHISAQSEYYQDFLGKKDESEYKDLFIRYKNFFENGGPSEEQVDMIYKRKPRAPYVMANFKDGTEEKVWCTFDEEQIDIHCDSQKGKEFAKENLEFLAKNGAAMIRLDAFAYATKKIDTNCFFVEPEVWNLLKECDEILKQYDVKLLPEIHEHYSMQLKIAEKGYTLMPLQVYFKGSLVKVQVGLARGKKLYDKRADIAKKDQRRELEKDFKVRNLY